MKVIDSREVEPGMRRRRYDTGIQRFTTIELPVTVLKAIGMGRVRDALKMWQRGEAQRAQARKLREDVAQRHGIKPTAVAHELGVTEARVRQIRKELMGEKSK
jgi:hypothetical protein